ncbi:SMI1/KNR4 family protein [Candidatus Peregrinibacteria bacterium]|nr:SMI1/KNR4 family protein [Candidatus Peregrinibacteria bacterium]
MELSERLKSIKNKLEELRKKDKEMKIFGAGDDQFFGTIGHHYELNPVLSEEEILAVEKKLEIKLPEEYRAFIKELGNGGAGPAWGLFTLEKSYPEDEFLKDYPHFCSMTCDYGDDYANGIRGQKLKDPYYMEVVDGFGGFLKLSDYGHQMTAYMVVGGDQQVGKMWFLDEDGDQLKIAPMMKSGDDWQVSFLDWYEGWLEESFAELEKAK